MKFAAVYFFGFVSILFGVLTLTLLRGYAYDFSIGYYALRFCLVLAAIVLFLIGTYRAVKDCFSERKKNLLLSIAGLVTTLLVLELVFMFVPRSHQTDRTLASRIWYKYYWSYNSLGFRDSEQTHRDSSRNKVVAVLGDSFVAGHGIKDMSDRFVDRIRAHLGQGYQVFSLGINGATTLEEIETLRGFPYPIDVLILSHLPNDIHYDYAPGE